MQRLKLTFYEEHQLLTYDNFLVASGHSFEKRQAWQLGSNSFWLVMEVSYLETSCQLKDINK